MERRRFGPTRRDVAVIGQGTWQLESRERTAAVAALRRGLDLGMTHIDTAEMYGAGVAEQWVAEAIASRRDEVFLVSKVLPENALRVFARSPEDGPAGLLPAALARAASARGHDRRLRRAEKRGKILAWGASNFDVPDLEAASRIAGEGRIACNRVLYHLQQRAIEYDVVPRPHRRGIPARPAPARAADALEALE